MRETGSPLVEAPPRNADPLHGFLEVLKATAPIRYQRGFQHVVRQGFSCPFHRHPAVEIVYHPTGRGGTALHTPVRTHVSYEPGTVVIYPKHSSHSQRIDADGTDCCIHFLCETPMAPFFEELWVFQNVHESRMVQELTSLSNPPALLEPQERTLYDLRLTTLLAGLWSMPDMQEPPREPATPSARYVRAAKRILSRNLSDPINSDDLAGRIGINADYLRHLFVQHEGRTLSQWLRELRLQRAGELLAHSTLPHKAIAVECGFQNERYFCTVFRKQLGLNPRQYRLSKQL